MKPAWEYASAAEEIEALRGELERLRAEQDNAGFIPWRLAQDAIDERDAEIERLRAQVKQWEREWSERDLKVKEQQAELERLREENEALTNRILSDEDDLAEIHVSNEVPRGVGVDPARLRRIEEAAKAFLADRSQGADTAVLRAALEEK